jgi:Ca-activated chloride channel family protein
MRHAQATPVPRPRGHARRRLQHHRPDPAAQPGGYVPPPPEHHQPTPFCCEPAPSFAAAPTPYDGVTFADPGTNPFIDPQVDHQSTFGLDIDTASYTVARRFIDDGNLPDPASVRVEEFVNYFDQGYAPPEDDAFRDPRRRWADPVPRPRRDAAPDRRQGPRRRRRRPAGRPR